MDDVHVNGEEIITTPEHPFYVPSKGWIKAIHLRAGDALILQNDKYVIVEMVQHEILEAPMKVYNFGVEDFHTYYVGESAVLVHNECNKSQAKKVVPSKFEQDHNLEAGTFHREIKPQIKSMSPPNYTVGKNPDILMDRNNNIAYQGAGGRGYQDTGLNMIAIFEEMGMEW